MLSKSESVLEIMHMSVNTHKSHDVTHDKTTKPAHKTVIKKILKVNYVMSMREQEPMKL